MQNSDQSFDRMVYAIADPARRRILEALKERGGCSIGKEEGLCASDIELRIHLSQSTISHHMAVLRQVGLVKARKIGQWMWYRRDEDAVKKFVRTLADSL